jgi:hypothetical protein
MSVSPGSPNPDSSDDLLNPMFLVWLTDHLQGGRLEPDVEDYQRPIVTLMTDTEVAEVYREAQAHKLLRMYATWKASQN